MPALQCSAVKCMYNKDNLCSKGDIQVKGDHAATENETWCSSFVEKTGMSNAYTCGGGCSSIQVGCAAHDCTYNRQEVCQADHVHIDVHMIRLAYLLSVIGTIMGCTSDLNRAAAASACISIGHSGLFHKT